MPATKSQITRGSFSRDLETGVGVARQQAFGVALHRLEHGYDHSLPLKFQMLDPALQELKGDPETLRKIDDAEALLRSLRSALS